MALTFVQYFSNIRNLFQPYAQNTWFFFGKFHIFIGIFPKNPLISYFTEKDRANTIFMFALPFMTNYKFAY